MKLKQILQKTFFHEQFRTGQKEVITDILAGQDVLGILPTGSGKSLCYQLPSLLLDGLTVVISPLISLMIDQVRETKAYYFKQVTALHSMQMPEERKMILQRLHLYKLIYISPELIQQDRIINHFIKRKISLFVIDEAHCISQWGHDFRPDYLRLHTINKQLQSPPILALSGTVTEKVRKDIKKQLNRPNMIVHEYDAERDNIALIVEHINQQQMTKKHKLLTIIQNYEKPTIIYFTSRKQTERIAQFLRDHLTERKVAYYHGGLESEERLRIQQQFLHDQIDIICATSAFGMGINKQNIRLVIHYHLPLQTESFIQEIGRAGRDGRKSASVLLYEEGDEFIAERLINSELPSNQEINHCKQILYSLVDENKQRINTDYLEQACSISNTKANVLQYQLEVRGIIKKGKLRYNEANWKRAFEEIRQYCQLRLNEKLIQFRRLLDYVFTTSCLRKTLYRQFQSEIKSKTTDCCSQCNFTIDQLTYKQTRKKPIVSRSWKEELAYLLGIEDYK